MAHARGVKRKGNEFLTDAIKALDSALSPFEEGRVFCPTKTPPSRGVPPFVGEILVIELAIFHLPRIPTISFTAKVRLSWVIPPEFRFEKWLSKQNEKVRRSSSKRPQQQTAFPFFHGHCATFTGTRPEKKNRWILSSVFKDSYNIRGSSLYDAPKLFFFFLAKDGIPQTGRWKTDRSLRWPPLRVPLPPPPESLPNSQLECPSARRRLCRVNIPRRPVITGSILARETPARG